MNAFCWIATIICITGTIINIKRINTCFYLWAIGEVMWLSYDLWVQVYSRACLDGLGLVLAIIGIYVNCIKKECKQ